MPDSTKAFVSYSRDDLDFVLRLCQDLRQAGAAIWLDKLDITPGEEWDLAVERGLAECGRMLVVLSPRSVASQNVLDEVGFALTKKKVVVPVLFQDCEIPYRLSRLQYVDVRSNYEGALRELLSALQDTKEARTGDVSTRDAALASGAQWVSTDYPTISDNRFGTPYFAAIPGGTVARCNPINAPAGCVSSLLERAR